MTYSETVPHKLPLAVLCLCSHQENKHLQPCCGGPGTANGTAEIRAPRRDQHLRVSRTWPRSIRKCLFLLPGRAVPDGADGAAESGLQGEVGVSMRLRMESPLGVIRRLGTPAMLTVLVRICEFCINLADTSWRMCADDVRATNAVLGYRGRGPMETPLRTETASPYGSGRSANKTISVRKIPTFLMSHT